MMTMKNAVVGVWLGSLLLLPTGCEGPTTCGEGTVLEADVCVPEAGGDVRCGEGTVLNAAGDACEPCPQGTYFENGECIEATPRDGGSDEDRCGPGTVLVGGECIPEEEQPIDAGPPACEADCVGRVCGDDGCGGTCGECDDPLRPTCNTFTGQCEEICIPQCEGRTCGDDGCGSTCGTCDADATCLDSGRCLPDAWTCPEAYFGGGDICDCDCGGADPDCAQGLPLAGCEDLERCNADGQCVPVAPAEWTCSPLAYAGQDACDCNCGAYDPDCDFPDVFGVSGCGLGVTSCNADGSCGQCTPDCEGRVCGDDGCGGRCGECDVNLDGGTDGEVCRAGECIEECGATPAACLDNACGDDGCGGSCGTCAAGSTCTDGQCQTDPVEQTPFSCYQRCGSVAPSGCYCTPDCVDFGNCCDDFAESCTCTPDCTGKTCGSDGCGGSCGTCDGATPFCADDGQCTDQCTPTCDGRSCGPDGCGGSCGICGDDETCYWTFQCVPEAWTCDGTLFGDRQGCDCGCGAADPDCSESDVAVFGCPAQERVCGDDGICEIEFCHANAECPGAWCTGAYAEGTGRFGGFCGTPTSAAEPPGAPCSIDEECASNLCAGGLCRQHCQSDTGCPENQVCQGVYVRDNVTQLVQGYVGVCEVFEGTGQDCASQATCGDDERCIALLDPVGVSPRLVCAAVFDQGAAGQDCSFDACPAGYRCENTPEGAVCALPCPGGQSDCGTGFACIDRPFAPLLDNTSTIPMCLPE